MHLKLHNRQNYPVIFVVGVVGVTALWFLLEKAHPELLLSGIGAVGGFAYFLYRQHLDDTRFFKELFVDFNARYDKLGNDLNKIYSGPEDVSLSNEERDTIFKYFNLCAEEHLFHEEGYIKDKVWNTWRKGMAIYFRRPRIAALWKIEEKNDSYYGFQPPLSPS